MTKWEDTYDELKKRKKLLDSLPNEVNDNAIYVRNTNTPKQVATLTTKKSEEKKWYQNIINLDNAKNIVNTKPFDDGYDFGDVTKAILGTKRNINQTVGSTVLDVGTGILKGASDIGVAGAKLVSGGVAQVADWIGKDEYAEKVRKKIAGKDEETNKNLENKTLSGLLEKANSELDKKSILGETADEITNGLGYYTGMLAAQSLGVPWQVTAGVTSAGNELGNAYRNDAKDWEAWLSSGISAGVEIGSEYIFGGVKLPGTGKAIENTLGKVTEKISKNGLKYLMEAGIQIGGEGLEEVISGVGSAIGQKLTYMNDKELKELYTNEDALKDFVIGAAVSGLTIAGNTGTYKNIQDGRSLMTGRTVEEAEVFENAVREAQAEAEAKKGSKLTTKEKNEIEEQVKNGLYTTENETQKEEQNDKQRENTEDTENITENTENLQNSAENIVENNAINKKLNDIVTQINQLESQLDTSQNAVQQQEILNQINALEQKYNEILQQEQNTDLPVQDVQSKELQTNEDIAPIQEVTQKEISTPTTPKSKTNLTTETDNNTPKDIKSSPNIEVGKNNKNTVNKEVNNEVNQVEERKVINNEITENLQEQSIDDYKNKQLEVINKSNPADDSYHTWIRSTDDIKTFDEAFFENGEYSGMDPDFTEIMAKKSKETGKITIYSSFPIENGVFVSPSQMEASQYAGGDASKLYSKEVNINDVAWIDGAEGQYAKVDDTQSRQQTTTIGQEKRVSRSQENGTPTQQELNSLEDIRLNKSGSEYASAFYDLENKYGKSNLSKALNEYKSTDKAITNEQVVKQVSEQVEDAIAPIQKSIKELKETITEVKKATKEAKTITEADLEDFYRFTRETASNEAPVENSNLYQEDINREYAPTQKVESPLENRNIDEVGNRSVKAYQYEHPEVKPYFQQMANYMLSDLENSTKGERYSLGTDSDAKWTGTTRNTTSDIAYLLDNYNYTYADIKNGLEAIIKNHGAENIAVAKRIEFALDERLRNGYTDVSGLKIPADQNYINMLKEQEWTNYYDSIPTESIAPLSKKEIVDLENQIDNALSNSKSKAKRYLGKVTDGVANKIKSLLGIDVKNRKHVLADNDIRHMINQHGNQEIESRHGQIAITKEDIKNIPEIINNPDNIIKGTDNKLGQTIRYIKRYNDHTTYVVEVVPDNSNALIIKTMWKKPSTLTNSIAPSSTSETQGSDISSTYTDNISQNIENVNDIGPVKERYNKANENRRDDTSMIKIKPDKNAFEKRVMESAKEIEKELGYIPKDPTKESSYDLTDTSENKKIAEILTEEPTAAKKKQRLWAITKANIFDKGAVFEDLSIKTKNRNLMGKWDYTLTSEARAQNVIGNGHKEYDSSTKSMKQTSKSLNDIVAEVENTGLKKEFYDYMYHKHNVDRMNLESKAQEKIIDLTNMMETTLIEEEANAIEKQINALKKTVNKPVFGESVTSEVSQRIVEQYENENPLFMDYAQDVYDYVNADKQQLVKEGVISQETADLWSEMYPHYIPIRRVDSSGNNIDVPLDTRRTGVNAPIKKATGGNSDILPLFDTMAMRTLQTYRATAKNSFGVELKNTLATTTENQQTNVDEVIDSIDNQDALLQENNGKPTFTVFENGEKKTYSITQDMYDALKPLSESSLLSKTFKPFNTASSFHKGLLTEYSPVFMITNAVKDIQDVLINSQHTAKTYSKLPEAYTQLVKKGYWYQEYISNGGEQNSYFDSQENTFKTENKGIKKLLDIPPFSTISKMNNFIEMAPRLAEYIASREQGRSIEVSMLDAARVTTNFKAGGNLTKWANRNGFTFLNASVQGAMQQVRNIREANMNGLRGWANLATKFAIAGLPALLLNGLMWDDDDDYEELSDYVKQNYYVVWKKDDGTFIRIPKGRTVAVIQEAIQQVENAKTGNDEVDLKSFLDLVLTNLAPNNPIENNILSPITQVINNKTWYGEDLVPTRLQNLPANEQYDESTDVFSKWLGDKINVSPVKINYLLNQYSGGAGDVVLPMITPKATNDADSLGDYLLAPFKDKFTTDAVMNNKNVGNLFDTSEKLTKEANKSNATDEDVLKNKYINYIKKQMNDLYKEKREIQNSDLSKSEKYKQVRGVQEKINALAKEGMSKYKGGNYTNNYGIIDDKEYYLNSKGDWTAVKNDEVEELNNMNMSLQDKSKYFNAKNEISKIVTDYKEDRADLNEEYEDDEDTLKDVMNSLSSEKKNNIINAITNTGLTGEQQAYLYKKYYKTDAIDTILDAGIGVDTYFDYVQQTFEADYNSNGKVISGSKKSKVISYVNNYDLSIAQKAILIKSTNTFKFNDYNNEIVNYIDSLNIPYKDKVYIFKKLDMTIDDAGYVHW